ncbi:MAG: UDP-2,3-diacylglucosamine diphosphatase [Legionellaceae bacterium]|nr:UDP-2,3-diacylglucosamine diphosphatase [Legionellaceae bacterium]
MIAKKYEAVFISDIHLHPDMPDSTNRFYAFVQWAAQHTSCVYILGDFFHVWPGDEAMDSWSEAIADQLAWLSSQGVAVFFMPGNRDFLIGKQFLARSNMQRLAESTVIKLGDQRVLLVHGDRYCTLDKGHQWLRRLTRNRLFTALFLRLSYPLRARLVSQVREYSQANRLKPADQMVVVVSTMLRHLRRHNVDMVIHGHTHKPGLTTHRAVCGCYQQYVLSDWDENPRLLCYNNSKNLCFDLFGGSYEC